jgi:hypothetical protein
MEVRRANAGRGLLDGGQRLRGHPAQCRAASVVSSSRPEG